MNTETKEILTDAVRYWEPRRVAYNLVLVMVSVGAHYSLEEAYRQKVTFGSGVGLLVLAVVANLLYCAAYVPDVAVQHTAFRARWRKLRVGLFLFGTIFASLLAFLCVAPLKFD